MVDDREGHVLDFSILSHDLPGFWTRRKTRTQP
jgi:hypothetical protein